MKMSESLKLKILIRESISAEMKTLKTLKLKTRARETSSVNDVKKKKFSKFKNAYKKR